MFNLDDVDAAFALVQPLRYQQNMALRWGLQNCQLLQAGAVFLAVRCQQNMALGWGGQPNSCRAGAAILGVSGLAHTASNGLPPRINAATLHN